MSLPPFAPVAVTISGQIRQKETEELLGDGFIFSGVLQPEPFVFTTSVMVETRSRQLGEMKLLQMIDAELRRDGRVKLAESADWYLKVVGFSYRSVS